jgi:hypothetical protein
MRVFIAVAFVATTLTLGRAAEMGGPPCDTPSYAPPMREPSCDVPQRTPPQPPQQQPPQPQAALAAPQGMFVQPPASGVVRGPVERRGLEGLSITFHGCTLRLPSIQLPALSRSRTPARMDIDAASAPYVEGYPAAAAAMSPVAMAPQMMMAPPMQVQQPPRQEPPPMAPPAAPPEAPSCDAPRSPQQAPGCDAYYSKQAALEERLRQVELAEQRLAARLAELQQISQRIAGQVPLPSHSAAQVDSADRSQYASPVPSQVQAAAEFRFPEPAPYGVAPARYAAPIRLPPDVGVVNEPAGGRTQITGLRGRAP